MVIAQCAVILPLSKLTTLVHKAPVVCQPQLSKGFILIKALHMSLRKILWEPSHPSPPLMVLRRKCLKVIHLNEQLIVKLFQHFLWHKPGCHVDIMRP